MKFYNRNIKNKLIIINSQKNKTPILIYHLIEFITKKEHL